MSLGVGNKLVLAFVTLIIGAVLVGTIATQGLLVTDKLLTTDEQFDLDFKGAYNATDPEINESYVHTVANPPTSWKVVDCPLTNLVLANSSGQVYTITDDYIFSTNNGTFTLKSTVAVNSSHSSDNLTLVTYNYCGDDYMNLGWGRSTIKLVAGFFALAILGASLALFWSVAKDTGLL